MTTIFILVDLTWAKSSDCKINCLFLPVYSKQSRSSLSGITDLKKAFRCGFRYPPPDVARNGVTAQGVTTSLITKLCTAFGTFGIEEKFVKELCKADLVCAVTGNGNCRLHLICARVYVCVYTWQYILHEWLVIIRLFSYFYYFELHNLTYSCLRKY